MRFGHTSELDRVHSVEYLPSHVIDASHLPLVDERQYILPSMASNICSGLLISHLKEEFLMHFRTRVRADRYNRYAVAFESSNTLFCLSDAVRRFARCRSP